MIMTRKVRFFSHKNLMVRTTVHFFLKVKNYQSDYFMQTWTSALLEIIPSLNTKEYRIFDKYRPGTDTYLVPSSDKQDLLFHLPLVIRTGILDGISLPLSSSPGALHAIIEYIKKASINSPNIGHLYGRETGNMSRYSVNIEPCTIAHSPSMIGSNLWRPDDQNMVIPEGIRLSIRGAIPYLPLTTQNINSVSSTLSAYIESMADFVCHVPPVRIRKDWEATTDQQHLRSELHNRGLICFIGDGTRPARSYTRHRSWFRVAGPKEGVHIPFSCPKELDPVEVCLQGSNRTITGLGIRKGEILAITGSNAEGKSTLLQAIQAGEDDHAPGDGREELVTIPGGVAPDATGVELKGSDLKPFFSYLPPGMSGNPSSAFGQGSGSASMASRISDALRKRSPYIIIDEDRAAQNLMVPCYMSSSKVRSLATLIREDREWLFGSTLIIAGSGMELLVAQADRIVRLCNHEAKAQSVTLYRDGLQKHYESLQAMVMEKRSGEGDIYK